MANNVFKGQFNFRVAKTGQSLNAAGLNAANTTIVYQDGNLLSWVPGRPINGFDSFTANRGYYIQARQDMDIPALVPPLTTPPSPLQGANIVFDGNSLTFGTGSTNPATKAYPQIIAEMPEVQALGITITNMGVAGQTTSQMQNRAETMIDTLYQVGVLNILVGWEIGNDLWQNGSNNGANDYFTYNRWQQYAASRDAAFWNLLNIDVPFRNNVPLQGGPLTPGGDTQAQYDAARQAINNFFVTLPPAGNGGVLRLSTRSEFQAYNPTYYNPDELHFNDAGYALIAQIVWDKIKEMYG